MLIKPYEVAQIQFQKQEEIGHEGENSKVFKVHDRQLDATIVIKEIKKNTLSNPDEYFKEAQILYKTTHPNIVQIFYACENPESIFIGMPYYKNSSINKIINTRYLTTREILRYSLQTISGLHNIHAKGLIHFDIKPDNILMSDRNEALVSDFGLCRHMNYAGIAEQDRNYLKHRPPESFNNQSFNLSYDIYQMGLTMYRMCNGNEYFNNKFNEYINVDGTIKREQLVSDLRSERFPDRDYFLSHIPKKLQNIIKKCLSADPSNRYLSCIELQNALAEIDDTDGLDWQYQKQDGKEIWSKNIDSKITILEKSPEECIATKGTEGGIIRRIKKFCKDTLTPSELTQFFKGG